MPREATASLARSAMHSRVDLAIVVLRVHDDHQVSGDIHTPAEAARGNHHLNCT